MGTPPKKMQQEAAIKKAEPAKEIKHPPQKKLNCFVMTDKPEKPGLILVSTTKTQDGCYVLGWQPQQATWIVSESQQWYQYADKVFKANLAFTSIFALSILVLLFLNRGK